MEVDILEIVLFFLPGARPFIGGMGHAMLQPYPVYGVHGIESWRQYFECADVDDDKCAQLNISRSGN